VLGAGRGGDSFASTMTGAEPSPHCGTTHVDTNSGWAGEDSGGSGSAEVDCEVARAVAASPPTSPAAAPARLRQFLRKPQTCALPPQLEYCPTKQRTVLRRPIRVDSCPPDFDDDGGRLLRMAPHLYPTVLPAGSSAPLGVCGLDNLGNTCYMNSALQCLSNLSHLRDYFRTGRFMRDLNQQNPIGCGGKLAESFGALLRELWRGAYGAIPPVHMRATVGKFNNSFASTQQMDAHEFLNWFLDHLHEDLNRVRVKKYVEYTEDLSKLPDEENAKEALGRHLKRNDSLVQDLFASQIRSRMKCPECGYECSTFEQQVTIDIGLQRTADLMRAQDVYLMRDGSEPMLLCGLVVRKDCSFAQFKHSLAEKVGKPPNSLDLVILEPKMQRLRRCEDRGTIADVRTSILVALEVEAPQVESEDLGEVCSAAAAVLLVWAAALEAEDTSLLYIGRRIKIDGVQKKPELNGRDGTIISFLEDTKRFGVSLTPQGAEKTRQQFSFSAERLVALPTRRLASKRVSWLLPRYIVLRVLHFTEQPNRYGQWYTTLVQSEDDSDEEARPLVTACVVPLGASDEEVFAAVARSVPGEELEWDPEQQRPGFLLHLKTIDNTGPPQEYGPECKQMFSLLRDVRKLSASSRKGLGRVHAVEVSAYWRYETHIATRVPQLLEHESYAEMRDWEEAQSQEWTELTVEECLAHHTMQEQLDVVNAWSCPACKNSVSAYKEMSFWTAPPEYLIILLKRMTFASGYPMQYAQFAQGKLLTPVKFPLTLDFAPYMARPSGEQVLFDLSSVVCHSGRSVQGGHYYSHARNDADGHWYCYDDEHVRRCTIRDVLEERRNAYVLCYRRRHEPPPSSPRTASESEESRGEREFDDTTAEYDSENMASAASSPGAERLRQASA